MDDDKKNSNPPSTTAPILDVPLPVGSAQKEQGPVAVSEVLKPAETAPEISSEIADFITSSQPQIPTYQIIRAAGESTPVPSGPSGIVELPTIQTMDEAVLVRKTDSPLSGKRWQAEERIREELRNLKKAA